MRPPDLPRPLLLHFQRNTSKTASSLRCSLSFHFLLRRSASIVFGEHPKPPVPLPSHPNFTIHNHQMNHRSTVHTTVPVSSPPSSLPSMATLTGSTDQWKNPTPLFPYLTKEATFTSSNELFYYRTETKLVCRTDPRRSARDINLFLK
ncbi:hypothetical protein HAX54_014523, partial [Datura stramonium]|nr:hypothetical protein [Datura stramonium]